MDSPKKSYKLWLISDWIFRMPMNVSAGFSAKGKGAVSKPLPGIKRTTFGARRRGVTIGRGEHSSVALFHPALTREASMFEAGDQDRETNRHVDRIQDRHQIGRGEIGKHERLAR